MEHRSVLEDIYVETLRVFTDSDEPSAPRTTPEVATELDCGRRATHKRLQHLVDLDELRTKKVGASARVWWLPAKGSSSEQRRLRDLLTNAERLGDVGAWEYDIDDEKLFWTDGARRIHHVDSDYDPDLEAALNFYDPADEATLRRLFETCLETGVPYSTELRLRTATGERRWVHVSGEAVSQRGRETVRGYLQDITAQREHEHVLESQQADLEVLNSLNGAVRQLTDAVIDQSTRDKIEAATCEQLGEADLYQFAWIATIDPVTLEFIPQAECGVEGYVAEAELTTNPTEPGGKGPAGRAARTQEMQVSQDVFADSDFEMWLDLAERYDYRSAVAIPIAYQDTLYGVLGLYSARADAFGTAEREVLAGIGDIVGHAIAAVERKQALVSDEIVELSFRLPHEDTDVDVPSELQASFDFESTIPMDDGDFLVYGTVTGVTSGQIRQLTDLDRLRNVENITVLGETNGRAQVEVEMTDPPILTAVTKNAGYVSNVTITATGTTVTVHLAAHQNVSAAIDRISDAAPGMEMLRRRQRTRSNRSMDQLLQTLPDTLTERQRTVLDTAYFMGYFDWPRGSSGPEVAARLGVSSSTFHQHLRKAEQKLLDAVFT